MIKKIRNIPGLCRWNIRMNIFIPACHNIKTFILIQISQGILFSSKIRACEEAVYSSRFGAIKGWKQDVWWFLKSFCVYIIRQKSFLFRSTACSPRFCGAAPLWVPLVSFVTAHQLSSLSQEAENIILCVCVCRYAWPSLLPLCWIFELLEITQFVSILMEI